MRYSKVWKAAINFRFIFAVVNCAHSDFSFTTKDKLFATDFNAKV